MITYNRGCHCPACTEAKRMANAGRKKLPACPWLEVTTRRCYGGWYWEVFHLGIKVNGGLAEDRGLALAVGCSEARMRSLK